MKVVPLALALAAVVATFAFGAHLLATSPVDTSAIWPEPGRINAADETDAVALQDDFDLGKVAFKATLSRPLFSRSRRKFVAPPKPKPAAPKPTTVAETAAPKRKSVVPPPKDLSLIGISLRNGESSALVAQGRGNNLWVSAGDQIAAWKVAEIDANTVRLTQGGQEVFLRLYQEHDDREADNAD